MEGKKGELVSVIVPVYNIAPYIEECLASIQRQTYPDIEIIVVDDGSDDGSGDLCKKIAGQDARIKLIRQKNAGVVAARNRGIENSDGKYIIFIDGDDWIEQDMIEELVGHLGDADLITCGVYYQETAERTVERYDRFPEGTYSDRKQMNYLLGAMIYDKDEESIQRLTPWCVNKLYHIDLVKEVYQKVDESITFAEDSVFLYQYLLRCRSVAIMHQCFYHYRFRGGSAMHAVNDHMLMDINRVYLALEADFRKHELCESLVYQLQKWIVVLCCRAVNFHMGFEQRVCIPEFIANLSGVDGKKLILYGAGQVGQNTYVQLKKFGYDVVLWADKNYMLYQSMGMSVESPEKILDKKYDLVFIAVSERVLADEIIVDLSKNGVPAEMIVWKEPIRI